MEDINKDIEILENLLEEGFEAMCYPEAQAIEHLIQAYKELEEENEDLKNIANNKQWISPCYVAQNYISKSKIKEKIEELDKEYIDILSDYGNIDTDVVINIPNENVRKYCEKLGEKIIVLQELLEKRK